MFIKVKGTYAREDLGRVLGWVWSTVPEDVAKVCSLEVNFTAIDLDGHQTYVAHIEGKPPGIVLTPEAGSSPDGDTVSIKWIYPGVPRSCSSEE